MEYMIQYGTNGKDFSDYKEVDGSPKLFRGNEDGDYVSRYVINPTYLKYALSYAIWKPRNDNCTNLSLTHSINVFRNDFEQPIIAKWIRINPTRWADRIAIRMELYGCRYIPDVLYFNGKAMISKELVSVVKTFFVS